MDIPRRRNRIENFQRLGHTRRGDQVGRERGWVVRRNIVGTAKLRTNFGEMWKSNILEAF